MEVDNLEKKIPTFHYNFLLQMLQTAIFFSQKKGGWGWAKGRLKRFRNSYIAILTHFTHIFDPNGKTGINVADKPEGENGKGGSREGLTKESVALNYHRRHRHLHPHHHVPAPVTINLFREAKQRLNVAVEDRRLFRFNYNIIPKNILVKVITSSN